MAGPPCGDCRRRLAPGGGWTDCAAPGTPGPPDIGGRCGPLGQTGPGFTPGTTPGVPGTAGVYLPGAAGCFVPGGAGTAFPGETTSGSTMCSSISSPRGLVSG